MAKVKIVLWKYQQNKDGSYPLRLRIYKNGKIHYRSLGYSLKVEDWNDRNCEVRKSHPNAKRLNHKLAKEVADTLDKLITIENKAPMASIYKIKDSFAKEREQHMFFEFGFQYFEKYNNPEQKNTFKGYVCKLEIFQEFVKGSDLSFEDVTVTLIREFETFLRKKGKKTNTIGTNMKRIRQVYRAAVVEGYANANDNPFNQYRIKRERTKKIKLSKNEINRIRKLDLEPESNLWYARSAFLLSYNLMGMRVGDVALLKWNQIVDGRVDYVMRKTKNFKSIALTSEAKVILNSMRKAKKTKYVFPHVEERSKRGKTDRLLIEGFNGMVNPELKTLAKLAKINKTVSMHIARHSWAQSAYESGLETRKIQKGLGHADINTTITYLADLTDTSLDELNEEITS